MRVRGHFRKRKRVRLLARALAERVAAPTWSGVRPRMSGSAKVVCPLPPKVVPSSEKSAWFWLMGSSCPLHSAQPRGAKLKDMSRISERKGSAMSDVN